MKILLVCAAVIARDGKILLAQRKNVGDQGLLWEFPGGKLIPGESPEECLSREILEELAMQIEVKEILEVVSHSYRPDTQILLLAYLCNHVAGAGETVDCNDFRWVAPEQLGEYELAAADIPVLHKLMSYIRAGKK